VRRLRGVHESRGHFDWVVTEGVDACPPRASAAATPDRSLGRLLRRWRRAEGLSSAAAGRRLAVYPTTYTRWEEGRRPYPRHLIAIAEVLGEDPARIVAWVGPAPRRAVPRPPDDAPVLTRRALRRAVDCASVGTGDHPTIGGPVAPAGRAVGPHAAPVGRRWPSTRRVATERCCPGSARCYAAAAGGDKTSERNSAWRTRRCSSGRRADVCPVVGPAAPVRAERRPRRGARGAGATATALPCRCARWPCCAGVRG
jgi:transcriptional regulator with XRE-family HTH domain